MAGFPKTIRVRQTGSAIRKPKDQSETLKGLGLGKIGRERELEHTLPVLGMIVKVAHLVEARDPGGDVVAREDIMKRMSALRAQAKA